MVRALALAAIAWASFVSAQCTLATTDLCNIQGVFSSVRIVPGVIPTFNPQGLLTVAYPSIDVAPAQQLDPARVSSPPLVSYAPPGAVFNRGLLLLIDPDSVNGTSLYWAVANVAIDYATGELFDATSWAPYISPAPSSTTPERFVFLLYNAPLGIQPPAAYDGINSTTIAGTPRANFDLAAFLAAAGLAQAAPIAGLYFDSASNTGGAATTTVPSSQEAITVSGVPAVWTPAKRTAMPGKRRLSALF